MHSVIPAINCHYGDAECAESKLRVAEEFAERIHLDISDSIFTFAKSWGSPDEWKELKPKIDFEVHLMVEHPENAVDAWFLAGAKRIIFHYEAFPNTKTNPERLRVNAIEQILRIADKHNAEAMLAINPETEMKNLEGHLARLSAFQVFSQAVPGSSGQKFLHSVLPKIRALREQFPDATIEVDGGITPTEARLVYEAGASAVVVGSYIFNASDPQEAYRALSAL